ncbi:MAG: aminotransferase class IV [Bacteroidales bacterium]|jgi:branched-subunit amino acid aminotransferase/4-amino-4-deoxychorismate lyase|nr:aminotransferase class IV [Bacteroidales bacterium]
MKKQFYIFEGELFPIVENATFCVSECSHEIISEQVRLYNTRPLFLEEHLQHLQQSLESISVNFPEHITAERISRYITRLLNVNKVYKGGICSIHCIISNLTQVQVALTITALPELSYSFNDKGLHALCDSNFVLYPPYLHSSYNCNSSVYIRASRYVHYNNYDLALIYNANNCIESTTAGVLVYMKQKTLFVVGNTPKNPLFTHFLHSVEQHKFSVEYNAQCVITDISGANDIFVFNSAEGIRWISELNAMVYGFKYAKDVYRLLVQYMHTIS